MIRSPRLRSAARRIEPAALAAGRVPRLSQLPPRQRESGGNVVTPWPAWRLSWQCPVQIQLSSRPKRQNMVVAAISQTNTSRRIAQQPRAACGRGIRRRVRQERSRAGRSPTSGEPGAMPTRRAAPSGVVPHFERSDRPATARTRSSRDSGGRAAHSRQRIVGTP